jgi:hypothetical protein
LLGNLPARALHSEVLPLQQRQYSGSKR